MPETGEGTLAQKTARSGRPSFEHGEIRLSGEGVTRGGERAREEANYCNRLYPVTVAR